MNEDKMYFTEREAMKILRLSRSTIYKLRKAGLPHLQIGGAIRYELGPVQEWLRKKTGKQIEPDGSEYVRSKKNEK